MIDPDSDSEKILLTRIMAVAGLVDHFFAFGFFGACFPQ